MGKPEPNKRLLKFDDFDALMIETQSLLENGYTSNGNWTLGQATSHIADWMRYPVDGFPNAPTPIKILLWLMKVTIGPGLKKKIMAEGFSAGMQTSPSSVVSKDEMSDEAGVAKLRETIERVMAYEGKLNPSPLFGEMDKATLKKVTLLHAEHHLGYLVPKS